jgi:hypothetical protein
MIVERSPSRVGHRLRTRRKQRHRSGSERCYLPRANQSGSLRGARA